MGCTLVIGVDSSTTACKAIAWDARGNGVAEGRAACPLITPRPHWYEQDAEQWWAGLCTALNTLWEQIDPTRIAALCITHQRETFVPVDEEGRPLRHAILWLDERSRPQVTDLQQSIGAEHFHRLTGKPLTTNPALPKIVWLMQHEPYVVERTAKFLDVHAFLVHRLTGEFRTSIASADPFGLVDLQNHTWAADLMHELGLQPGQFPELVEPGTVIGRVSQQAAAITGLPAGLPVVAGAGDGQCAGLGANAVADRASLNLGTAVVSGTLSQRYVTDCAFRTLYAPIAGLYFLETVIQSGAFIVNWFTQKFGGDPETLEAAAAQVPPGSLGLVLVPYWSHAMTPYWDPLASGIVVGWNGAHGSEHFYRAILEGIAFEQRLSGEGVMMATGKPCREYIALGGGSRSDLWCQIIADVTGTSIRRAATDEATCLGAGILAAVAAGWYHDPFEAAAAMSHTTRSFTPDARTQLIYEQLYTGVYRQLFPTLRPLLHCLAGLATLQNGAAMSGVA